MNNRIRGLLALAALTLLAMSAAPARATTLTQSWTVPLADTDWFNVAAIPAVLQWDPAAHLGMTLFSVTGTYTSLAGGSIAIENINTTVPSSASSHVGANSSLVLDGVTTLASANPFQAFPTATFTIYDGALDFAGTSGLTNTVASTSATTTWTAGSLAPFIGNGTVDLKANASGNTGYLGSGGTLVTTASTHASALGTVTYNYSDTPEPGMIGLLGCGLLGLPAAIRRRKRSA